MRPSLFYTLMRTIKTDSKEAPFLQCDDFGQPDHFATGGGTTCASLASPHSLLNSSSL